MKLPAIRGHVAWVFGEENFDVDQIIGTRNVKVTDIQELAKVAMSDYDAGFAVRVRPGDVLVGGVNFGYGHPHYGPLQVMRHFGIAAVIAESFSPGLWRGEVSNGFALIPCAGILAMAQRGDELEVDWIGQQVINHAGGARLPIDPIAESDLMMIATGGLLPYLKQMVARDRATAATSPGQTGHNVNLFRKA